MLDCSLELPSRCVFINKRSLSGIGEGYLSEAPIWALSNCFKDCFRDGVQAVADRGHLVP